MYKGPQNNFFTCKLGGRKPTNSGKTLTHSGNFAQNRSFISIFFLGRNRWQKAILHTSKCAKTHLQQCRISKKIPRVTVTLTPRPKGRGSGTEGRGEEGKEKGREEIGKERKENRMGIAHPLVLAWKLHWRPLANKPTANQQNAIYVVTVAVLLAVCEIFSRAEVENRHFRPMYSDCNLCIAEHYIQSATILSLTMHVYLHSFSRCCLSNLRNHAKFRENSNFDLGANGNRICSFLVIINSISLDVSRAVFEILTHMATK